MFINNDIARDIIKGVLEEEGVSNVDKCGSEDHG